MDFLIGIFFQQSKHIWSNQNRVASHKIKKLRIIFRFHPRNIRSCLPFSGCYPLKTDFHRIIQEDDRITGLHPQFKTCSIVTIDDPAFLRKGIRNSLQKHRLIFNIKFNSQELDLTTSLLSSLLSFLSNRQFTLAKRKVKTEE